MIAKVILEKYLAFSSGVLDYAVPEEVQSEIKVGQLVKVPFQKTFYHAVVVGVVQDERCKMKDERGEEGAKITNYELRIKNGEEMKDERCKINNGEQAASLKFQVENTKSNVAAKYPSQSPLEGENQMNLQIQGSDSKTLNSQFSTLNSKKLQTNNYRLQTNNSKLPAHNLKNIEQILCSETLVNEQDLLIAQEVADYYLCSIASVLKLFLPKNIWKNKIHKPKLISYFLNPNLDFDKLKLRGKNQLAILDFLKNEQKVSLDGLRRLPEYKPATVKKMIENEYVVVEEKELQPSDLVTEVKKIKELNEEQNQAYEAIVTSEKPVLLHGITGSGKTEVYLQVIRHYLEKGRTALVLVPEIFLTTQIVNYFENVFGEAVAVIHSKLSDGEKEKLWWQIKLGQKKVVIGARTALFYPYPRLGTIVVDEAHEWSYKSDQTPRYHAVKVAEILAKYTGAKLILGTATPGVEERSRAESEELGVESEKIPLEGDEGGVRPQVKQSVVTEQSTNTPQPPRGGLATQASSHKLQATKYPEPVIGTGHSPSQSPLEGERQMNQQIQDSDSQTLNSPLSTLNSNYRLLTLSKRIYEDEISGEKITKESKLPEVRVVDLREEVGKKNYSPFADTLLMELKAVLANGEQALLFLNKRGTSSSILCKECGYVAKCQACEVAMTYHEKRGRGKLVCHYCGRMQAPPNLCPNCNSPQIRFVGAGTQKIERDLKAYFPQARIARVDRDTTANKDAHTELYTQLKNEEIDIVIGTQIIAKGFDLPKVSLVGVLNADVGLNIPDFRSGEKIFQLLTQVTGRAGRRGKQGKVILQTYSPENFILQAIKKHDYDLFYKSELKMREELNWPPYSEVVKLTYVHYSIEKVLEKVEKLKKVLLKITHGKNVQVLSAPALIPKLHNKYHWNIILKGEKPDEIIRSIRVPPGWRVDREPLQVS